MSPRKIREEKTPVLAIVHYDGAGVTIGRTFELAFALTL